MPIGGHQSGVAVGPNVGPRGVDPNLPGFGQPFGGARPSVGLDLQIIRYDEKILSGFQGIFDVLLSWQPQEQQGDLLLIDRIVVAHFTSATTAFTDFFATSAGVSPTFNDPVSLFEFTELPRDVADENPPIILRADQHISVRVQGMAAGDPANVHFWYRIGRLL